MNSFRVEEEDCPDAKFHKLMWGYEDEEKDNLPLPPMIKIKDPMPGELPFMKKRRTPAALRFRKHKREVDPVKFSLDEMFLFDPTVWEGLYQHSGEEIMERYEQKRGSIARVKQQVMEHLEHVEEAREYVEKSNKLDLEETGAELDPDHEQEEDELEDGEVEHPEYEHLNPGEEEQPRDLCIYRKIDVPEWNELKETTLGLDPWQRRVVDEAVKFARDIIKSENPVNRRPNPPHLMVHGGAGSGKTTVIRAVVSHVERILRKDGDESGLPYIIKCAPTGAAASLIEGMTLHKAFGFRFVRFNSLPDRDRDRKRTEMRNLKFVIIDEVSMMKADMLYQIDLRLQEVMGRPRVPFGGVCLMCFGDMLQLRPVLGNYIFQRPKEDTFSVVFDVAPRWSMLKVINLEENHRQGDDKAYADLLLRMRTESHTEEDLKVLRKRVFKKGHIWYKDVATTIVCTNAKAKEINDRELRKMEGEEMMFKAKHSHALQPDYKPMIDEVGQVGKTSFVDELVVKKGCPVMLVSNIDVADCLSNGQLGTLVDTVKGANGVVKWLMIKFKNVNVGKEWRQRHPGLAEIYPGCTGVEKLSWDYNLKEEGPRHINIYQFPIKVAFAVTAHKIQGQSILKPAKVAVDLAGTKSSSQAYVMLSRVEDIEQIGIMGDFKESNVRIDKNALAELQKMNERSMNRNPTPWRDGKEAVRIAALNVMNLRNNHRYLVQDPTLRFADIVCVSETWLSDGADGLSMEGYEVAYNSVGPGKGVAAFFRAEIFNQRTDCRLEGAQMSMFESPEVDVIIVYRSQGQNLEEIADKVDVWRDPAKVTVVCGDMNVCLKKEARNKLTVELESMGFAQLNEEATHIGGGHIDHMYVSREAIGSATLERYTPFYSDHDALCLTIAEGVEEPDPVKQ